MNTFFKYKNKKPKIVVRGPGSEKSVGGDEQIPPFLVAPALSWLDV